MQKELIDIRNQSDGVIYSVEKTLKDYGEKISFEDRSEIDKKLTELKTKKEGTDIEAIKRAIDDLQQSVYKLSEAVYQGTAQQQGQEQEPQKEEPKAEPPGGEEGGADYRVVDEETDKDQQS